MIKSEIYYDSKDEGKQIVATIFTPNKDVEIVGVLQIVHGMIDHIGRYEEFASFMVEHGFVVAGEDHLGHGKTGNLINEFGYFAKKNAFEKVLVDIHTMSKILKKEYPDKPFFILGHSMGSFFTRNYITRWSDQLDGAIIMGTGHQARRLVFAGLRLCGMFKHLRGDRYISPFIDKMAIGSYNLNFYDGDTGMEWLTKDNDIAARKVRDPYGNFHFTVNGYETLFRAILKLYNKKYLSNMRFDLPVFFVSGSEDPVGERGVGVKLAKKSIEDMGATDVSMKIYQGDRHEILNEIDRFDVFSDIYNWIMEKINIKN
ncbi:MAG: alpha/beta fold hydrolase [Eubacteriales bacterium]|nr:alpha/beta fold hydrolase [Eubacteriales bacterium]MDY3332530.1 alpha/beta fold hydrolase [Gallibacter sp.]